MMLLDQSSLGSIHRFSHRHRPLVEQSKSAGCYHCGATFTPAEITEWIEEHDEAGATEGETARCPQCHYDAVLPSAAPIEMDERLLAAVRGYLFAGER
jgi:hypothetical protein